MRSNILLRDFKTFNHTLKSSNLVLNSGEKL